MGMTEGVSAPLPGPTEVLDSSEVIGQGLGVRLERGQWRGQDVFVKVLTGSAPELVTRFHREGQIASRLAHPNIVPLLAHTQTQLIYRYVPGPTLRERFIQGTLDVPEALTVVRSILSAVAYAHMRGVTHLDLKPENVILEGGRARVTDFGLSHDRELPRITARGDRMGTPQYMAPEQYHGLRHDPRSDLYAVAVILYEALTGEGPHPDPLGWLMGRDDREPQLPPPMALHPVLESGLSHSYSDRPSSALAMLTMLEKAEMELARK